MVVVLPLGTSGMWGKERAPLSMDAMRLKVSRLLEGLFSLLWVKVATT